MHFLQSFVWASVPILSFSVGATAVEHQVQKRNALVEEQAQNWLQRLGFFKRQYPLFCNPTDPYFQMVQSHYAGSDYCASILSVTSTMTVYVTPTTTVTAATSSTTYTKTSIIRATSTSTVTVTQAAGHKLKRGPQVTARALLPRGSTKEFKAAKAALKAFADGSTDQASNPQLSSACDCLSPDAHFATTVTSTDYVVTATIDGYNLFSTVVTSTSVVRTVTTTTTVPAAPNQYYSPPSSISKSQDGGLGSTSSTMSSSTMNPSSPSTSSTPAPPPPPHNYGGYSFVPPSPPSSSFSVSMAMNGNLTGTTTSSMSRNLTTTTTAPAPPIYYGTTPSANTSTASVSILYDGEIVTPSSSSTTAPPPGYPSNNLTLTSMMPNTTTTMMPNTTTTMMPNTTTTCTNGTYSTPLSTTSTDNCTTTTPAPISTPPAPFNNMTSSYFPDNCTTTMMHNVTTSWDGTIVTPPPYPISNSTNSTTTMMTPSSNCSFAYITLPPVTVTVADYTVTVYTATYTMNENPPIFGSRTTPSPDSVAVSTITMPSLSVNETSAPTSPTPEASSVTTSTPPSVSTPAALMTSSSSPVTSSATTTPTAAASTSQATAAATSSTPGFLATVIPRQLGVIASASQIAAACSNRGNQLLNEGFEQSDGDEDPTDWVFVADDSTRTFFFDTPDPSGNNNTHGGSLLGEFKTFNNQGTGDLYQALTLCPGKTYSFSGFYRQLNKNNACSLTVNIVNDNVVGYPTIQMIINEISTTNSGDWETLSSFPYTVPIGSISASVALEIEFYCYGTPSADGYYTMDIDDLSLSQIGT